MYKGDALSVPFIVSCFSFNSCLVSDIWFSGVWSLLLGVHCLRKCGSSVWVRSVGEMGFKIVYGVNSILFTVVLPSDYMRHIYQTFIITLARNTLVTIYMASRLALPTLRYITTLSGGLIFLFPPHAILLFILRQEVENRRIFKIW